MAQFADRVKVSNTTTASAGSATTLTLGSAEAGYQAVPSSLDGETIRYVIEEGNTWEIGTGTYTHSGTTLSRSVTSSSNSNNAIAVTSSAKVFITPVVDDLQFVQVYSSTSDLPSASDNHGRITHVHGDGAMYFAHGGNWIKLANASDAISLTDLSVTQNAASGSGALTYNSTTGAFSYTPPASTSSSGGTLDPIKETETVVSAATQSAFNVAHAVDNIAVYLNGSRLSDADWNSNSGGTTVTLTTPAVQNDIVTVVEYGAPFAAPYSSAIYTVGSSSEINANRDVLTADYTQGKEAVYVNGVKYLSSTDYSTNTGGTAITFTPALSAGDIVELVEHGALADAASAFTDLTDTPSALGTAGQVVQVNSGGNALEFADASGGVDNQGTLTKTFVQNEEATITLSDAVSPVPMVSVFKEIPQVGVSSKGNWDVTSTGANYDRFDEAPVSFSGATLTPSNATANGTFTLSSGSFASTDVGKTVEGNSGKAIITGTSGSYHLMSAFTNTNTIAAGSWALYGAVPKSDGSGLELSNYVAGYQIANGNTTGTAETGQVLTTSSQDGAVNGFCLGSDDMSVITVGSSNDDVYQYDLSVAGDLSTATFNNKSFDLGTLAGSTVSYPDDVRIKPDGTKLFVLDGSSQKVYSFDLSTPNDITTASYDTVSPSMSSQESSPNGIHFKPDGTKMWMVGSSGNMVFEYNLTTAWDVSTLTYAGIGRYVQTAITTAHSLWWNPDGTEMYVIGTSNHDVAKYNISPAWDLAGSIAAGTSGYNSHVALVDVTGITANTRGLAFNSSGTHMYVNGATQAIHRIDVSGSSMPYNQYIPSVTKAIGGQIDSSAWTDINSMTADEELGNGAVHYAVSTDDRTTWSVAKGSDGVRKIAKNNSGTWQYNDNAGTVSGYDLSSPTDDNSAFNLTTLSGWDSGWPSSGFSFNNDGSKAYALINAYNSGQNPTVFELNLSQNYDISTASYSTWINVQPQIGNRGLMGNGALSFSPNGDYMYIRSYTNSAIYVYSLNPAWDLSTASYSNTSVTYSSSGLYRGTCVTNNGQTLLHTQSNSANLYFQTSNNYGLGTVGSVQTISNAFGSLSTPNGLLANSDGSKVFVHFTNTGSGSKGWVEFTRGQTGQFSTSDTFTQTNVWNHGLSGNSENIGAFSSDGTKMLIGATVSSTNGMKVYSTGSVAFSTNENWVNSTNNNELSALQQALNVTHNRMNKAQLDAVTDANHFTLGNTLDLMIAVSCATGTIAPKSDGVSINYDAATLVRQAAAGTDYEAEFPSSTSVKIKSLAAQNLKVRVI